MNSILGIAERTGTASVMIMALVVVAAVQCPARAGTDEPATSKSARETARASGDGIWKAIVPPGRMASEFEAYDPIGLAAGAMIKADCSINWRDPDTGRLYCFASGTSLNHFLAWPRANIRRATEAWQRGNVPVN
ncbi:MAG: hypothetical protein NW217_10125 [Hyphomicrobiaceae bacterium]|nr:hypothetical protein [Hyphomicrobiaceae bacterium]